MLQQHAPRSTAPQILPSGVHPSAYVRWAKPVVDRVLALGTLLVLCPLFVVLMLLVRSKLGSPVFYRQHRVGQDGTVFRVWKFRTMLPDRRRTWVPVDTERRVCHKRLDDPRHTGFGKVLRRWSLDELPQLLNVVSGDMSLVGPRPELVEVVAGYERWQHRRHLVKPGITGPWQIYHRMDGTLMHEHTEVDLDYVDRVGLRTDLRLLARTIPAALGRSGH